MRTTASGLTWTMAIFVVFVGFVVSVSQGCGYRPALKNSIETRTFTASKVERGTEDRPELVYTDVGVFSVQDSLWLFKFDASDRYGKIFPGKTYTCKVAGWRVRFLSWWENLIDCKEVAN